MGSDERLKMAEARGTRGIVYLHLTPDGFSCRNYNLSVEEAKHFRRRLSAAIRAAEPQEGDA